MKLTTVESMLAGALAGSATVLITNPIWVINTRMTTRKSESNEQVLPGAGPAKSPSTLGTLLALLREEGPARLFAGVMPALVLVINPILQYTFFEKMKQFPPRTPSTWAPWASCWRPASHTRTLRSSRACTWLARTGRVRTC
jgi:adenine nucleotide transporter 17